MKDILIETNDPVKADELLQQFGVLMMGGGKNDISSYEKDGKFYKARCLGDLEYAKFAIEHQGYTSLVKIIDKVKN